jgi:hypothetical protein
MDIHDRAGNSAVPGEMVDLPVSSPLPCADLREMYRRDQFVRMPST